MRFLTFLSLLITNSFFLVPLLSQNLLLEDIFASYKYREHRPENVRFLKDDHFYSIQEGASILKKETKTGKTTDTLVSATDTLLQKKFSLTDYTWSFDEKRLLLRGNTHPIYRRSYTADYVLVSFSNPNKNVVFTSVSYATFSPDAKKIAYVKENNLYCFDIASGQHVSLTSDGLKNAVINGSADWVYEEELEVTRAFEWSPDSKHIAYYRFDERKVPEYVMQKWEGLYPIEHRIKYPKAGEINSILQIKTVELASRMHQSLPLDTTACYYVPRIQWSPSGTLIILGLNRPQTSLSYFTYLPNNQKLIKIYGEQNNPIEIQKIFFLGDKNSFLTLTEKGGIEKALLVIQPEVSKSTQLIPIKGLENIYLYDPEGHWVYYSFSLDAIHKQVARLSLSSNKTEILSTKPGQNSLQVSEKGLFYILTHHSAGEPSTVTLFESKTKKSLRVLEANEALKTRLSKLNLPKQEFFHFRTGENIELNGWMIKPVQFDSVKRYPVILYVYGGPGDQKVVDEWQGTMYLWHEYLATQGYLVACVDGRGTGGRSTFFRNSIHKRLGELETKDQIEAARYFTSLPFVNRDKIGIWGWSFGGYLSSNSLLKGNDLFKAAIAVAPVTNWRFYNTIYTERYLGTPQENPAGYDQNSPIMFADRLKGNYLLIHGTSDDNVHIQNTFAMQEALIKAGKQFDTFIYPNKSHGISGGNTRYHLHSMMLNFWNSRLKN